MPGVSARSSSKNMSRAKRAAVAKNSRRVAAALADELELCTYGKVSKACGNKMFRVIIGENKEHLAHIRGKMARININDIVLLNIREYESRADTSDAVYDIMAVFSPRDVARLIKSYTIPSWMASSTDTSDDLFEVADEDDDSEEIAVDTKDKKSYRSADVDTDIDVDNI
jgi:translation initiation factor IF-1